MSRWERLRERLRSAWSSLDFHLARRFGLATRGDRVFFALIGVTGVVAGTVGVLVHTLINALQRLLWGGVDLARAVDEIATAGATTGSWWWWALVIGIPAAGGLVVGVLFHFSRGTGRGSGMSLLIESVLLHGGRVPPWPVIVNGVASVVTVGAGGSLGREGPMIRLGAMASTWMASRLHVPPHRVKILLGCGAAAGLAAAYNVPIGGALFAMEVILGNFALEILGPIVAASVISTFLARSISGDVQRFEALGYQLTSGWEILTYAGLGLVGALASVAFVLGIRGARRGFDNLPLVPAWLKPLLGMAMLGGLAVFAPQILDGGAETMQAAIDGQLAFSVLVTLAAAKLLATALTAGSGGAGGLFTPSLFFGGLVGGAYGYVVHGLWPEVTSPYGAYAVVGMAAMAAGTSHAPISAILILFELTGNYELILPLMVAAIISGVVSRRLHRHSMYTESLERKGIDTSWRMEEAVLAGLKVSDMVRADPQVLSPAAPYGELVDRFLSAHRQRLFVVGEHGELLGAVSLHDIKHVLSDPERLTMVVAHDLMVPVELALSEKDRLHRAAEVFAHSDFERLPVIGADGRFRGVLAKRDLLSVYAQEVLGRPSMLATFVRGGEVEAKRDYVELPPDFALRMVPVPASLVGKSLAEAALPQTAGVRVLEIKRGGGGPGGGQRVIPDAGTVLAAGDGLILLGPEETLERLEQGRPLPGKDEAEAHLAVD
jgi:chloride channel protein, CIC family